MHPLPRQGAAAASRTTRRTAPLKWANSPSPRVAGPREHSLNGRLGLLLLSSSSQQHRAPHRPQIMSGVESYVDPRTPLLVTEQQAQADAQEEGAMLLARAATARILLTPDPFGSLPMLNEGGGAWRRPPILLPAAPPPRCTAQVASGSCTCGSPRPTPRLCTGTCVPEGAAPAAAQVQHLAAAACSQGGCASALHAAARVQHWWPQHAPQTCSLLHAGSLCLNSDAVLRRPTLLHRCNSIGSCNNLPGLPQVRLPPSFTPALSCTASSPDRPCAVWQPLCLDSACAAWQPLCLDSACAAWQPLRLNSACAAQHDG